MHVQMLDKILGAFRADGSLEIALTHARYKTRGRQDDYSHIHGSKVIVVSVTGFHSVAGFQKRVSGSLAEPLTRTRCEVKVTFCLGI
jgi:hypothetical protein